MTFWSIVGQASRHTALPIGPSTRERSKGLPFWVPEDNGGGLLSGSSRYVIETGRQESGPEKVTACCELPWTFYRSELQDDLLKLPEARYP